MDSPVSSTRPPDAECLNRALALLPTPSPTKKLDTIVSYLASWQSLVGTADIMKQVTVSDLPTDEELREGMQGDKESTCAVELLETLNCLRAVRGTFKQKATAKAENNVLCVAFMLRMFLAVSALPFLLRKILISDYRGYTKKMT